MRDLKYIIVKPPNLEPRAILFNGLFNHSDIWLGASKSIPGSLLLSAGFCDLVGDKSEIAVWGESESLTSLLKRKVTSDQVIDPICIFRTLKHQHIL